MKNYYNCDDLSWKESLFLLKQDLSGQRIYSTLWLMTKDVLRLGLSFCAAASLILLIPLMLSPLDTWQEGLCMAILLPLLFILPVTWILAYFGWYKNIRMMRVFLLQFARLIADNRESYRITSPLTSEYLYRGQLFYAIFREDESLQLVTVAKGEIATGLFYRDPQGRDVIELQKQMLEFLKGKRPVPLSLNKRAITAHFRARKFPPEDRMKDDLDMLLYLVKRYGLEIISQEEAVPEEDAAE